MHPIVIGLTGGIGSGKTVASDNFAALGVPIIDTDVIARSVVEPGQAALAQLVAEFGEVILLDEENGERALDRDKLRDIAFASPENKSKLDAITHPAIRAETMRQLAAVDFGYCVVVVPLLTSDSPFTQFMQRVITVNCDRETRIQRVMRRSQLSRDAIEAIMQTQLTDKQRSEFADDIIDNNGTLDQVREAVEALHEKYLMISVQAAN